MSLIGRRGAASSRGTGEFIGSRTNPPWTGGSLWAACFPGSQASVGLPTSTNVLTQVGTDTDWKLIATDGVSSGNPFTIALKNNGTMWATGSNGAGQLGLGDTTTRTTFTQVGTDTNWKYVASGSQYSLAIKTDGTLWGWGRTHYGQLGLGIVTDVLSPTQIGTGTNWAYVAGGDATSYALKTDGTLWSCGSNFWGELGQGITPDNVPHSTFAQVGSATNWASVYGTTSTGFAITTDGQLWGCGRNDTKMIENSTTQRINNFIDLVVPYPAKFVDADVSIIPFIAYVTTDGAVYGKGRSDGYMPGGVPGWYPGTVYTWTDSTIRGINKFTGTAPTTCRQNTDGSVQFAGFPTESMGIGVVSSSSPMPNVPTMGSGRYWDNGVYNITKGIWISLFP